MNTSVRQFVVDKASGSPKPVVSALDAVGIVVGAGIFRTPSIAAGNAASTSVVDRLISLHSGVAARPEVTRSVISRDRH